MDFSEPFVYDYAMSALQDIEIHKKILLDFLNNELCKRPSMFVGNRDFEKIAHFFDGYTMAIQHHINLDLYRNWNLWVAKELDPKFRNNAWWSVIVEAYGSSEKAIEQFPLLFAKYLASEDFTRSSR